MKRLRNFLLTTFIGGLVLLLPIAIFVFLVQFLWRIVQNMIQPLSLFLEEELSYPIPSYLFDVLSVVAIIVFCFLVGLFIRTRFGKNLFANFEKRYLQKLPLYSAIKETVKQFSGVKKMPFSDVVIVDVFGNGTRMTGFITDEHPSGNYTVFVPTGPNPTNGFIFHVLRNQVEHLGIQSDDAMRTIIGIGVGSAEIINY